MTGVIPSAWPSAASVSTSDPTVQVLRRLRPMTASALRAASGSSDSRRSMTGGLSSVDTSLSTSSSAGMTVRGLTSLAATARCNSSE